VHGVSNLKSFRVPILPNKFSEDLEKVIRNRALVLQGPWPSGLFMQVHATSISFRVTFAPVSDPDLQEYRSAVIAIVAAIKVECDNHSREKRLRTAC
jgi:hypothetical protein